MISITITCDSRDKVGQKMRECLATGKLVKVRIGGVKFKVDVAKVDINRPLGFDDFCEYTIEAVQICENT